MRRPNFLWIVPVLAFTLFFPALLAHSEPVPPPVICRISHLEGVVALKETPEAEWRDALLGETVPKGAQIITHKKAVCELAMGEHNALRIEENALATVTSIEPVLIDITKGRLYALVHKLKKDSSFEVRTPTCIASARGTGWGQSVDKVEVFENSVSVKNKAGEEEEVETGRGISLDTESGAFGDSYTLPPDAIEAWKKLKTAMAMHLTDIVLTQASPAVQVKAPETAAPKKLVGSADRTGAVRQAGGDIRMLMQKLEAKYRAAEEKIEDQTAEYDTYVENTSIALKIFRKGEKFRGDTSMFIPGEGGEEGMQMNVTLIYDGANYWSITPMGTMKVPAAQVEQQMRASEHWWNYLSERDTFVGEGEAEGRTCYVVDLEPGKSLPYTRIWIDKENFRLLQAQGPQDGHDYRFTFSDYRMIDGMDLPFKMQMYEDQRLAGEYITRSMRFNTGLGDDLFAVNSSGGGINVQEMMRQAMQEAGEGGE